MIKHDISIQRISAATDIPTNQQIQQWIAITLRNQPTALEITIRIVDETEMSYLNETYRKKQGPTNVLSFPYVFPEKIKSNVLGDVVLCAPVIAKQASTLNISLQSHWAHLTVHGILHLLGYDHMHEEDTAIMQQLEIDVLSQLGFNNPYIDESTCHDG